MAVRMYWRWRGTHAILLGLYAVLQVWGLHVSAQNITASQLLALQDIKQALDPSGTILSSWDPASPQCATWTGLVCDGTGLITQIVLSAGPPPSTGAANIGVLGGQQLNGSLSERICNLTSLQAINLQGNDLSGEIPNCIGTLQSLQSLDLRGNDIRGLPSGLGDLSRLTYLDLSLSKGPAVSLPDFLGSLTSLVYLKLSSYNLDGSIPDSWARLTNLQELDLSLNYLSGSLPPSLLTLTSLTRLDLRMNQLTGPLPSSLANLGSLGHLDLSANAFNGSIPSLATLGNLMVLDLNHNQFTDALPSSMASLTNLKTMDVSMNALSGDLPDFWGSFQQLKIIKCGTNNFSGQVPGSLGRLANLQILSLRNNSFSGSLPAELGDLTKLQTLDVSDNSLQGEIPASLGNLSRLRTLDLGNNKLDGYIPSSLGSLSLLRKLYLQRNLLRGPLRIELTELPSLQTMDLSDNSLSGRVPPSIGNLTNLTRLDLSTNSFTGSLPLEITNLHKLQTLSISSCSITGQLPSFANLTDLYELDLSVNQLEGGLPDNFVAPSIATLNLANNILTGSINLPSTANLSAVDAILLDNNNFVGEVPNIRAHVTSLTFNSLTSIPDPGFYGNETLRLFGNPKLCPPPAEGNDISEYCQPLVPFNYVSLFCETTSCPNGTHPNPLVYKLNGSCQCQAYLQVNFVLLSPCFQVVTPKVADQITVAISSWLMKEFPNLDVDDIRVWLKSAWPMPPGSVGLSLYFFQDGDLWDQQFLKRLAEYLSNQKLELSDQIGAANVFFIFLQPPVQGPPVLPPVVPPSVTTKEVLTRGAIVAIAVGGFFLVLLSAAVLFLYFRPPTHKRLLPASSAMTRVSTLARRVQQKAVRPIRFQEIVEATGGFRESNLLGEGSYGAVYKGMGPDNQMWAVKRTKEVSLKSLETFQQEVDIISHVAHYHIVKLIGFCDEESEQLLVYEYVPGGTLFSRLHPRRDMKPLTFNQRQAIATGLAEALHYLHTFSTPTIIHRDVKSDNILLDRFCQAKLADFGFLKNTALGTANPLQTRAMGTPGYMDPEYYRTHQVTPKSDVYSFGVVLLELITGRTPLLKVRDSRDANTCISVVHWAIPQIEAGKGLELVDPQLCGHYPPDSMRQLIDIAMACTQRASAQRPDMRHVASRLADVPGQPVPPGSQHSMLEGSLGGPADPDAGKSMSYLSSSFGYSQNSPEPMSTLLVGR